MAFDIPALLIREVENKKDYPANYDTTCSHCSGFIAEGDTIYFFGNKEKTCESCFEAIIEFLKYGR